MKLRRKTLIIGGAFVALTAPAAAFVLPAAFPDICASITGCAVTFTNSTYLSEIQALYQRATQIANEARNLGSIGNVARQAIGQNIGTITGAANAGSPQSVGDAAAAQVLVQTPGAAGNVAQIDARAAGADGAQQQAQVSNLYLSTLAGEAVKANALAAEQQAQAKNVTTAKAAALNDFLSGTMPAGEQL